MNNKQKLIPAVILFFTIAQLIVLAIFGYTPYPDSNGYILLAEDCIKHGEPYPIASQTKYLAFLWNIGAINATFLSLTLFKSVVPLLILYSLLKGVTAWLFYDIVRKLSTQRVALIALILYVLYPANYGEGTSVQSEVPFICLTMTAIWLCINRKFLLLAGIVLAIANYIRPFALVFLLSLLLFLYNEWKKGLKLCTGFCIGILFIGSLTYIRTGLFLYQAKTGWMALMQYSWDNSSDHTNFQINPKNICDDRTLTISEKDEAWRKMFFDWLKQNKTEYLSQMPKKFIKTYISDNINMCTFLPQKNNKVYMYDELSLPTIIHSLPYLKPIQLLTILNLIYYYLLLFLALLSLLYSEKKTFILPCSIIIIGTLMLLFVGHGETRFHQPFMPFFIMLSAMFIELRLHHQGR